MPLVDVTGYAWDHARAPFFSQNQPELWFRPNQANTLAGALLSRVEVQADLNAGSGAFTVQLEASPGITYTPVLRWLVNPQEPNPEMRAWGYDEWPLVVNPYPNGGQIGDLVGASPLPFGDVLVQLAPPPAGYVGWYLNAPGPGEPLGDPDDPASSGTGILEMVR